MDHLHERSKRPPAPRSNHFLRRIAVTRVTGRALARDYLATSDHVKAFVLMSRPKDWRQPAEAHRHHSALVGGAAARHGSPPSACPASEGLAYVSPRPDRAVIAEAGAPWRDRLLPLPAFMREGRGSNRGRAPTRSPAAFA